MAHSIFDGEKVRLRAYKKDDLALALKYVNTPKVSWNLRVGTPFPLRYEDEEKWFAKLDPFSEKEFSFAIERIDDEMYLGGCGLHALDNKNRVATIGIFLGEAHIGEGYGSDALRLLVNFCFNEVNLNRLKLNVFSFNKEAIACYEKVGFLQEGVLREEIFRNGTYHDEIIMGLLHSEWMNR